MNRTEQIEQRIKEIRDRVKANPISKHVVDENSAIDYYDPFIHRILYGQRDIPTIEQRLRNVKNNQQLFDYATKKYNLDLMYDSGKDGLHAIHGSPGYSPFLKTVTGYIEHSPHTLAHELGHAIGMQQHPILALGSAVSGVYRKPLSIGVGGAMMLNEDTAPYAGLGVAAVHAPTLIDEYKASKQGLDLLRELKYAPEEINASKRAYQLAGVTYGDRALRAAALGTALGLTAKYIHKQLNKNKGKQNVK